MATPLDAALHLVRQRDGRWHLRSTRGEWAGPMLRGRPADQAPTLLPGLYALCGGAHRLAARHALAAARNPASGAPRTATLAGIGGTLGSQGPRDAGGADSAQADATADTNADATADAQALRLDTLREHLRRLWLDAPRALAAGAAATAAPAAADLAAAPFMRTASDLGDTATEAAARRWIEAHVLQRDAEAWLAAWDADAASHADRWVATAQTWPARWLGTVRRLLGEQAAPCRPLRAAASEAGLRALADALRQQPAFALAPTEGSLPAETGCWTRLADPRLTTTAATAATAPMQPLWLRHAARIAELARLVTTHGAWWLAQGRFSPVSTTSAPNLPTSGPQTVAADTERRTPPLREGLGWCEMARGLLVHWVRLDADDRIAAYRVLAPTEWNFHPEGSAAQALVACAGGAPATGVDMAQLLATAAAYDPCVELRLETGDQERADA